MAYDMFNTAVSGLLSYQRALGTVSNNIANVGTEGYSKQRANFSVRTPDFVGGTYIGNGVQVDSITRAYDQFLTSEVRNTTSSYEKNRLTQELAGYVDNILADPYGGISPIMQDFFAAVNDVADDPTSTTSRNNLLNVSETMTSRFHNIDTRFSELESNTSKDIKSVVSEINDLVASIADANEGLNRTGPDATSTQQSADLLDHRDRLVLELSKKIDITVINEDTSSLSIFIGNGQTILAGLTPFTLEAIPNAEDPSLDSIVYQGLSTATDLTGSLKSGGELGALLEFRDNVLTDARNDLGRVAIAISSTFNEQQNAGLDLNDDLGTDFFAVNSPLVLSNSANAGSATIAASITDISQLTRFDYDLTYDGANWTLRSDRGNAATPVADASPADTTISFEGLEIVIDGALSAPVAGDSYRIRPTIQGAASFQTQISDPLLIAAAAAVRTSSSLNNLGTTAISQGVVTDGTDANLLDTVTFTFNDPATTFVANADVVVGGTTITAGTNISFTNNMTVSANGWSVDVSGVPAANDVLTVEANIGGQGDNRNALLLANLQNETTMDGGFSSYQEAYSTLVGRIGTVAASAETQRDSQQALLIQAVERKDSKTAVNLDEEAADLVRFQQAYQATSQIISTVQTLFETLLNATR